MRRLLLVASATLGSTVLAALLASLGPDLPVAGALVEAPVASERSRPHALRPPPTENWLEEKAEGTNKKKRKAWMAERRRAAPGVDVTAIERENGRKQILKRNRLGRQREAGPTRWVERGSANQAGRMHVARHSADHDTLYAGSALGGVWRASVDGEGWTPIGDNLYGGAHWLAVLDDEGGSDVVIAATDWGAIYRTADDGLTWEVPGGLPSLSWIRRLVVTSDGTEAILLVAMASNEQTGLYRSTDGGLNFELVYDLGRWYGDVWTPRDGGSELYLLANDQLHVSADLGETWTAAGSVDSGGSRGELVGSEAGAPRLWAVMHVDGQQQLWRSDDAGATWAVLRTLDDYWSALEASIQDVDRFAWGGVELHLTEDGGASFAKLHDWWAYYDRPHDRLHADMMGIDAVLGPQGEELWYVSTDGGLYRSVDRLETVENLALQGLRVSQYYDTLTSASNPEHVAAGSQDQGFQLTLDLEPDGELYNFDQVLSGDYAHLTSGDGTHGIVYSVYPGFILVSIGEDEPELAYVDYPRDARTYAWLPPVVADPSDPEAFFFCGDRIWRYSRDGDRWTPTLWSDESFLESSGEYVSALAFSPIDSNRVFAATSYGRLFVSDDRGVTWSESDDRGPYGQYFYGTALIASRTDVDLAYVGGSGYSGPAVYRTADGGRTWDDFDSGLPDTLVYSLGEAPDGSGVLVAGTETAVYRKDPGSEWYDVTGAEAPVTIYWSVEALAHENTMRFGTYGRGIWDYQLDPEGTGCYPPKDRDGDGHDCDVDCDDADPEVFPGAVESCDGVERSCDPEDLNEEDADGDGLLACEDCDDADAEARCEPGCRGCASGAGPGGGAGWLAAVLVAALGRRRRSGQGQNRPGDRPGV